MPCLPHRFARIAGLAAALLALPALSAPVQPACPTRPIVLGLYEFGHYYRAGAGLDKDVADQLAKRSGCKFDLRVTSRRMIWQGMQDGSIDITLSAFAPPERLAFAWAEPYLWVRYHVLLKKEVDSRVHTAADFIAAPNLRMGVGRGHMASAPYDEVVAQLRNIGRVEDVDDTDRMFAMFKAGRFHAMLGSPLVYGSYLKEELQANAIRIEDWSQNKPKMPVHMLVSKKNFSADESRRWGELMKSIAADGTMLRLVSRYVDADSAAKMLAP